MFQDEKEMKLLEEGDVIELKEGTTYAYVPKHFLYDNYSGVFDEFDHGAVSIKDMKYLQGKYIVHHTAMDGGGSSVRDGDVADGHHVWCDKIVEERPSYGHSPQNIRIDFYQTGNFTAMIFDITPINKIPEKVLN